MQLDAQTLKNMARTMQLDARTLKNIATLDEAARAQFADFALAANRLADKYGCKYIMISGNRTYAEQNLLYAKGRTSPGPRVTNARGGFSNHNFGIAGDFGVFMGKAYLDETDPKLAARVHQACAELAEGYGLSAGAFWQDFRDLPHYEIATQLNLAEKRRRFERTGSVL